MPSKGRVQRRAETKLARKQADSLKRNPATVKPNKIYCVVCEGEVTEPTYLRHIAKERRAHIALVIPDEHGGPLTVVKHAVACKTRVEEEAKRTGDRTNSYDEVWAVFDVDEHKAKGGGSAVPAARELAKAHDVLVAVSNPCFELWLLLHFRDQNAHIHRHEVAACVKAEFLTGYDKHLDDKMLLPPRARCRCGAAREEALQ